MPPSLFHLNCQERSLSVTRGGGGCSSLQVGRPGSDANLWTPRPEPCQSSVLRCRAVPSSRAGDLGSSPAGMAPVGAQVSLPPEGGGAREGWPLSCSCSGDMRGDGEGGQRRATPGQRRPQLSRNEVQQLYLSLRFSFRGSWDTQGCVEEVGGIVLESLGLGEGPGARQVCGCSTGVLGVKDMGRGCEQAQG